MGDGKDGGGKGYGPTVLGDEGDFGIMRASSTSSCADYSGDPAAVAPRPIGVGHMPVVMEERRMVIVNGAMVPEEECSNPG